MAAAQHPRDRAVRRWRRCRYHRPHHCAVATGEARPAGRGGKPARCRRHARQRGGRPRRPRRLHARRDDRGADRRRGDEQVAALRRDQGVRSDIAGRDRWPDHDHAPGFSRQRREAADRDGEGEPRQALLRQPRLRRYPAFHRRALSADRRHQHPPRAVPQLAGDDLGGAGRTGRRDLRHGLRGAGAGPVRAAQGTRGHRQGPLSGRAERAGGHRVGSAARLRRDHVVWLLRAERHPASDHRQAQQGDQRQPGRGPSARTTDHSGRRGQGLDLRGVWQASCERVRTLECSAGGRGHSAAVAAKVGGCASSMWWWVRASPV